MTSCEKIYMRNSYGFLKDLHKDLCFYEPRFHWGFVVRFGKGGAKHCGQLIGRSILLLTQENMRSEGNVFMINVTLNQKIR